MLNTWLDNWNECRFWFHLWAGILVRKPWLMSADRQNGSCPSEMWPWTHLDQRGWEWCYAVMTRGAPAEGWGLSLHLLSPLCRHCAICSPKLSREGRQFHRYMEKQKLWNQKFAQGHLLGLTLDPCKLIMPERVGQVGILPESFQVGRKSGQAEAPAIDVCGKTSFRARKHPSRCYCFF